eukprot:4769684-Pleurochrysis_carterae.AAC.4
MPPEPLHSLSVCPPNESAYASGGRDYRARRSLACVAAARFDQREQLVQQRAAVAGVGVVHLKRNGCRRWHQR